MNNNNNNEKEEKKEENNNNEHSFFQLSTNNNELRNRRRINHNNDHNIHHHHYSSLQQQQQTPIPSSPIGVALTEEFSNSTIGSTSVGIGSVGYDYIGFFRLFFGGIKIFFQFFIQLFFVIWNIILYFITLFWPTLVYLFFIWLIWYIITWFWIWVMLVVVKVLIPALNVIIILFNLFFALFIFILRIAIMIWNILVPFLFMILTLVIDVFVTVLADIFNIIGSIDWEPIINSIMQLVMPIVDMVMQIIMVFIKVGLEVVQSLSNVMHFLMEIIMIYVKVLVEIFTWVFKLLYPIIQPILKVIGAFFGAIASIFGGSSSAASSFATGRSLFSFNSDDDLMKSSIDQEIRTQQMNDFFKNDYETFLKETIPLEYNNQNENSDEYFTIVLNDLKQQKMNNLKKYPSNIINLPSTSTSTSTTNINDNFKQNEDLSSFHKLSPPSIKSPSNPSFNSNRNLFQVWKMDSTSGLKFIDEHPQYQQNQNQKFNNDKKTVKEKKNGDLFNDNILSSSFEFELNDNENDNENEDNDYDHKEGFQYYKDYSKPSNLDDAAHTVAGSLYSSAKRMHSDDIRLAQDTMNSILAEQKNLRAKLSMKTLLQEFYTSHHHLMPHREDTLAYTSFSANVEHPQETYNRFYQQQELQRRTVFKDLSSSNNIVGRQLLGYNDNKNHQRPPNWEEKEKEYMSNLKIQQAKQIMQQEINYKDYHHKRMKFATVLYSSSTKAIRRNVEAMITPQNVMYHFDSILDSFGYTSMEDLHKQFVGTYGDATNFVSSFAAITEQPFFNFLKRKDESRHTSPYFHDWAQEQQRLQDIRTQKNRAEYVYGRKLMQMAANEDRQVPGTGQSSTSLGGMAIMSTLNCQSSPKNPLCIPVIPANFTFKIPTINLTKNQENQLLSDIGTCSPWINTYCIVCWQRYYNAFEEVRFLLSAIPPVNSFFATLTTIMPWTGIFFNWIFIVPKYHNASVFQWVCFIYHLFDVFISVVTIWLIVVIIRPFYDLFLNILDKLSQLRNKALPETERYYQKQQDRLNLIWRRWEKQKDIIIESKLIGRAYFNTVPGYCSDCHESNLSSSSSPEYSSPTHTSSLLSPTTRLSSSSSSSQSLISSNHNNNIQNQNQTHHHHHHHHHYNNNDNQRSSSSKPSCNHYVNLSNVDNYLNELRHQMLNYIGFDVHNPPQSEEDMQYILAKSYELLRRIHSEVVDINIPLHYLNDFHLQNDIKKAVENINEDVYTYYRTIVKSNSSSSHSSSSLLSSNLPPISSSSSSSSIPLSFSNNDQPIILEP